MKRNLLLMLLLSVVASFASEALSEVVPDEKVKTLVIRSGEVIDNSWRARLGSDGDSPCLAKWSRKKSSH